jgi:uncharacterized protein (DUF58 family)
VNREGSPGRFRKEAASLRDSRLREDMRSDVDPDLFPGSFLRLLSVVPGAVRRLHAGVADGERAVPGQGGRFLFRGHREYRSGDDPRRIDWKVAARLSRWVVREYDTEKDVLTEVWLDGSASMGPFGGRVQSARAAALACAIGFAGGGRVRLGVLRDGTPSPLLEAAESGRMRDVLRALTRESFASRADLARALPSVRRRVPRGARFLLVSDLLSRAEPGILHSFAGRGIRGGVLHLRVPEVTAPRPGTYVAHDVESGERRLVRLDDAAAARVAQRAKAHADRWAHHAAAVGFVYLPFTPSMPAEALLRRIALEVP